MYRSLLVPLDGSTFGEHALPIAAGIARRTGATLRLAHVHVPLQPPFMDTIPVFDEEREAQVRAAERLYLDRLAQRLAADRQIGVSAAVLDGLVADALLADAAAAKVDLVVMATHGRGALSRFWLGSIADRLVRRAEMPVLLVRPEEAAPDLAREPAFRHVLVPLDGSAPAEQALKHVVALGLGSDTQYTLLQAIEPLVTAYGTELYGAEPLDEGFTRLRARAQTYLESVAAGFGVESVRVGTAVVDGPPARAILEYAHGQGVDLIAMATHGHNGLGTLLVGGVADKVLRGAAVPLLLHRPHM